MIRLGIKSYPFLNFYHNGPKVFMSRLSKTFIKNNSFKIRPVFLPNYDVALFTVTKGDYYNKPYFLRLDGLYIDKDDTIINSRSENKKIFNSIKNAKGLIFQSNYCKQITDKFYPENRNIKSVVINNGVPLEIFNPKGRNFRLKYNIEKNDKVLITSAHWRRHKRLEETIKLLDLLNKNKNQNYKLIVLGETKLSKQFAENKEIIFAGEVKPNNLPSWYRSADVYIHLAWIEPAGNTQNEAMACGLPVVCCNNGGLKDTVLKSNGGIISNSDEEYNLGYVDYYNPPEPNFSKLINDIETIFDNLSLFQSKIKYNEIDINLVATNYEKFIKQNL